MVGTIVITLVASISSAAVPYIFKFIIENFAEQNRADFQIKLFIIFSILLILSRVLKEAIFLFFGPLEQNIQKYFMLRVLNGLLEKKMDVYASEKIGEIEQILINGEAGLRIIIQKMGLSIIPLIFEFLAILIFLSFAFPLGYVFIVFFVIAVYLLILLVGSNWVSEYQRDGQKNMVIARGKFLDALTNTETIKIFSIKGFISNHFERSLMAQIRSFIKFFNLRSFVGVTQSIFITSGIIIVNYLVFRDVVDRTVSIGSLVLINMYLFQLLYPLEEISLTYRQLKYGITSFEDYLPLVYSGLVSKEVSNYREKRSDKIKKIELKNIMYFHDHEVFLRKITLLFKKNERVAIVGDSGSGKTTLLRLMLRLLEPKEGSILYNGCLAWNTNHLCKQIGYMPQDVNFFNEDIFFNIELGKKNIPRKKIRDIAEKCNITYLLDRFSDETIGERGSKLSGGEKQRLSLLRTLVCEPDFILIDEGTSALDIENQADILKLLFNIIDIGIVCVTHRLELCEKFDRIIVMKNGVIVEDDTFKNLIYKRGYFWNMYNQLFPEFKL